MLSIGDEHPFPGLERAVGDTVISPTRPEVQIAASRLPVTTPSEQSHMTETLKVSTRSRPSAVAGAIAGVMREHGEVDVQAIGAGATNQAIKAIAIARSYLRDDGIDVCCVPSFMDVMIDGEERTAVRLFVQHRPH